MKKEIISKIFCLAVFFLGVSSNAQAKKWTLEECVLYALENNISIKQSQLDLKTSDVERLEAVGNFLPAISANANYSMNTGANINPATNLIREYIGLEVSGGDHIVAGSGVIACPV